MVSAAVQIEFPDGFIAGLGLNWSQDNVFNENTHALINSVSTVGLAYNPNMSIVTINGQSLIQNNSVYMINYPGNSSGYPSNWATAIYNYSFYAPDVPDVYMSGLLINGNLVFANGAPAFGGTYNGVSYPEGKTFISLNPAVNLSTNNWSDSCVWPWEYYNQDAQYYLPAFACTLTSNWPV